MDPDQLESKQNQNETISSGQSRKSTSVASQRSYHRGSVRSTSTSASSLFRRQLEQKAKLQVSKSRLKYAEMEAELLKKQTQIEVHMKILSARREAEEAKVEYEVFCEKPVGLLPTADISPIETMERTKQYVIDCNPEIGIGTPKNELQPDYDNIHLETSPTMPMLEPYTLGLANEPVQAVPPLAPQLPTTADSSNLQVVSEFTKLFLKKELLLQRLTTFNDKPENYLIWKSSFFDIMKGLDVNTTEEADLLIRYLGPESSEQAKRMRAANIHNPRLGLERTWERLDERYGSPELISQVLKQKLENFSKFSGTSHDMSRLYELTDVLSEIQAIKDSPHYSSVLAFYDSPAGVNPIVNKLPNFLKSKWLDRASRLKQDLNILFPPFWQFVKFIREMSTRYNDPSLQYYEPGNQKTTASLNVTPVSSKPRTSTYNLSQSQHNKIRSVSAKKTEISQDTSPHTTSKTRSEKQQTEAAVDKHKDKVEPLKCLDHTFTDGGGHTLNQCRHFRTKTIADRKNLLFRNGICFRCCDGKHLAKECSQAVKCQLCNSRAHPNALHDSTVTPDVDYGGESEAKIKTLCTEICGPGFIGKSCAKLSLVKAYPNGQPEQCKLMYAIIDDQSNHSLAKTQFFNIFDIKGPALEYTLSSCSGTKVTSGRRATGYTIESLDGTYQIESPTLIECNDIPNQRDEIPTPEVAQYYEHLQDIQTFIPPLDDKAEILLLLGRDLSPVHHVSDQRIGPMNTPYAQKLALGWVVIGEACLGKVHVPNKVNVNKTFVLPNGRPTLFPPCQSIKIQERIGSEDDIFIRTPNDDKQGSSVEDKEFLEQMESGFVREESGNWSAPLPFKKNRPVLPNNYEQALQRAKNLENSLKRNPNKQKQFCEFMDKIFTNGHAEEAPPLQPGQQCWFLPIFGVYHPKKPNKIRVVFDSSAKYKNLSLNDVLVTGPDLTNNLLGVLLRFRKEKVAVIADIEQYFFNFYVHEKDRNYLCFLWYKDNDPEKELISYRMKVHVFGNSPSPSVSTFGLRKCVCSRDIHDESCDDICRFIRHNFYVDDGLISLPDCESAVNLVKRTQDRLMEGGNIRLHKISSNSQEVLNKFPLSDLATDLKEIDFDSQIPTLHRSLGLIWNVQSDTFTYQVSNEDKPFTRRGMLSTINSIFDPVGFLAPVILGGKLILRNALTKNVDWDQPLCTDFLSDWQTWTSSLHSLQTLEIPRPYTAISFHDAVRTELLVFCDASKEAIGSVAYVRIYNSNEQFQQGFVMGKSKLAPPHGHTIPRLELCAAVLAIEVASFILDHIQTRIDETKFFTDSKVVLGYINNETRRFYVYVTNRVDKIRKASSPSQWYFVPTNLNPADQATRSTSANNFGNSLWLRGPPTEFENPVNSLDLNLVEPNSDKEVRPDLNILKTVISQELGSERFTRFSSWHKLVLAISVLKRKAASLHSVPDKEERSLIEFYKESETLILKAVQCDLYSTEIERLKKSEPVPRNSNLLSLSPILDSDGLLRVGGRLNHSTLSEFEKKPVILSAKHHIATLLVRHHHENIHHQGRHLTEGSVRAAGYWITGGKRLIASIIHNCVICRRLRSRTEHQKMSDLPEDRLKPTPPFTNVGVDTFGPWSIITRRTRGGQANSKRWAILFSCLVSRAIHIEVVEDLSSSSFINSLKRFTSLRGPVQEFRSDRGTNFVGATDDLKIDVINVESPPVQNFLLKSKSIWKFNAPHASHMAGAWERMIGLTRRILDSMLLNVPDNNLTHEVLCTFMCEVCAIINARPIVAVSTDPESPGILSPAVLLTQKTNSKSESYEHFGRKDTYKFQWRHVQVLAERFWKQWQQQYLQNLQSRPKWKEERNNLKQDDVVLLKDNDVKRNQWPIGVICETFPSADGNIRKVSVRIWKDNDFVKYTRPISEVVYLLSPK